MSTTDTPPIGRGDAANVRWGVTDAAAGILLAAACSLGWAWLTRTVVIDEWLQVLGAYLAVWVPLVVVLCIADVARGRRSFAADFGLRVRWIDLLWGVGLGLLVRGLVTLIELAWTGRTSLDGGVLALPTGFALWFGIVIAPVVIGPLVEETFYRGLVLRAVQRRTGGRAAVAASVAVVVSALVFGLAHLAQGAALSPTAAAVTFVSTFVFGLAAGALAVATGRLGGAIIAHMVFNGMLVLAILS
ncbi:CPBP family intramembrane glutamic endopeptidase [Agromyces allii]|uniref:CPBP family intramembrane glutamic endopeptidase n=1 Tax=Agromyces allii TaxID=393607 RepID=UPI0012F94443|nr:CPBP family intramembrane glutamic endopeptidase [Agromyces allii]